MLTLRPILVKYPSIKFRNLEKQEKKKQNAKKNIEDFTWFVVINTGVKRKCIKVYASLGHKKSGVLLQVVYRRTYLNFSIKHLSIADNWMIRSLFLCEPTCYLTSRAFLITVKYYWEVESIAMQCLKHQDMYLPKAHQGQFMCYLYKKIKQEISCTKLICDFI